MENKKIKVYIPTHNRANTCSTHEHFTDENLWDFRYVVHNEDQVKAYENALPWLKGKILNLNAPAGVVNNRKAIDDYMEHDEWFISGDDDIKEFTKVVDKYYNLPTLPEELLTKENFNTKMTETEMFITCVEMFTRCDDKGYKLWGLNAIDNPFFRGTKIRENVFIIGWFWGMKKDKDIPNILDGLTLKEDYLRTAYSILYSGGCLRNDYVSGKAEMFQAGGINQNYEERKDEYKANAKLLVEYFDGLFQYNMSRKDPMAEVRMTLSKKGIMKWRLKMILKGKLPLKYAERILGEKKAKQFLLKHLNK